MENKKGTDFALSIIEQYYTPGSEEYESLVKHSILVRDKALEIAAKHPEMNLDMEFIEEGAMLHDVGVFLCDAPKIYCFGDEPYMRHGVLGAELLRSLGYERHARVCERHTGSGLTQNDIIREGLPLPHRDFLPESNEEKIICLADKFYSKSKPDTEKSIDKIMKSMKKYGDEPYERFKKLAADFL